MKKTKRVKIVTGLKCNIRCVFCYYRDSLNAPNKSLDAVKRDLAYAKRNGIEEVDFSGGEPTMHPDLSRMIAEAKCLGMRRVCVISNGWRLADQGYVRSLKAAGLDEILFSVHGSQECIHDGITMVPGSFRRISEALSYAAMEGISIRTNTVVNRMNYQDLLNVSKFVLHFQPVQVNFITINDWCFAKNIVDELLLSYSEMSHSLKEACDLLDHKVKAVNVRYVPFCFMTGYERFVCDQRQVPYDPFEWVPRVRARLEIQNNLFRYLGIVGYGFVLGGAWKNLFSSSYADLVDESVTAALQRRYYTKRNDCHKCRYDHLCDGVENTYAAAYGLDELSVSEGDKIESPYHFREDDSKASIETNNS